MGSRSGLLDTGFSRPPPSIYVSCVNKWATCICDFINRCRRPSNTFVHAAREHDPQREYNTGNPADKCKQNGDPEVEMQMAAQKHRKWLYVNQTCQRSFASVCVCVCVCVCEKKRDTERERATKTERGWYVLYARLKQNLPATKHTLPTKREEGKFVSRTSQTRIHTHDVEREHIRPANQPKQNA